MSLLEREFYLESLNAWLEIAAAGTGCIALVTGEAGIGKTSLIENFVREQDAAARVLWGGCEALFTPHPLAPLYDIARQIGGEFPATIAAETRREAVFNATIDQLAQGPNPTILVFEDAHWADEATLDLIKFLGRRLQRIGVMLVISYRDDEVNPTHPLCSVIGDLPSGSMRRLQLAPLSAKAVAALAEAAGRSAMNLYEISGGNPFFVTEALAGCENEVPATLRDAVIVRMARLSDSARTVVNLAALVPGKTERWLLESTTGRSGENAADAIQECMAVGMVVLPDGALAFRHELARRAVEESLPVPQRQALHACILAALIERVESDTPQGVSMARLVHHADQAGDSEAVLRFAPPAAERAAALGAHREAAAHYACALRHADSWQDACRADLFERQSYECYLTDQVEAAIAARESALRLWRAADVPLKVGDNLRWLSRLYWFNGQNALAERHAAEAERILESLPPGRELAMAYSNCAQLDMLSNHAKSALQWGQKAIDLATALDDREILSHAYNNIGTAKLTTMDLSGRADLERSLRLALDEGLQEHAARAYTNLASTAIRMHDFASANRYLEEGIAYSKEHDLDSWLHYMTAYRGTAQLAQGDWQKAADDAQTVIKYARVAPISRIPALVILGLVRARRSDPDSTTPLTTALELALPTGEIQRIAPAVAARAEAAWLRGMAQESTAEVRRAYELACKQSDPWTKGEMALWLWRCSGSAEAAGANDIAEPYALQIAGKWRQAAAAWEALGCPYEQAVALADGADAESLRLALEIFERLGAAPMAAHVRRKLRAGGVRGIARGAQERTRANPHGLTAREMKVLGLLVEGCRNAEIARRLFVAEKTVDHHVSAILAKLEVRSRGEAAAAANRMGLRDVVNG